MLLNSKNDPVLLDAAMKSSGERNGRFVSRLSAATASSANATSAQIFVPMAVPPRLSSYSCSTFRDMNVKSASSVDANERNS